MHHFKSIGEVKLELQPWNAQVGKKLAIFCPGWPWKLTYDLEKTIGHLSHATSTFVHHFIANGEFKLELQSRNAQFGPKLTLFQLCGPEIWWMTLKNNRVPLLSNIQISIYSAYSQSVKVQLLHIIPSLKISKSRFSIKSTDFHNIRHTLYGEFLAPYNLHKFSISAIWKFVRFYGENMEIHKGYGDLRYGR